MTMTMGTRMGHIIITAAIDDTTSVDCWALNECGYPTTEKTEQFAEITTHRKSANCWLIRIKEYFYDT
jgi:hypothetical protein